MVRSGRPSSSTSSGLPHCSMLPDPYILASGNSQPPRSGAVLERRRPQCAIVRRDGFGGCQGWGSTPEWSLLPGHPVLPLHSTNPRFGRQPEKVANPLSFGGSGLFKFVSHTNLARVLAAILFRWVFVCPPNGREARYLSF